MGFLLRAWAFIACLLVLATWVILGGPSSPDFTLYNWMCLAVAPALVLLAAGSGLTWVVRGSR